MKWERLSAAALLLLCQEHRQGCLLCFVLADIADFFSLLCYFEFICILSGVPESHTDECDIGLGCEGIN